MKNLVACLGLGFGVLIASSTQAQSQDPAQDPVQNPAQDLAQNLDCVVSGSDMRAFATLDYNAFNYGPDGWRTLYSNQCYYDAGASIISWLVDHEGELDAAQQRTQHYQAARNFALADRKTIALLQLHLARDSTDAKLGTMNWNAYLDAFNAWLSSDQPALLDAIARLERQQDDRDGRKPNLEAAMRFKRCFSKPYTMIEQDPVCLAEPAAEPVR